MSILGPFGNIERTVRHHTENSGGILEFGRKKREGIAKRHRRFFQRRVVENFVASRKLESQGDADRRNARALSENVRSRQEKI